MNVHISGGMTGIPNLNFSAFDKAADKLLAEHYWVYSPADAERQRGNQPYGVALRDSLKALLKCDAIYMLREWEKSQGARLEWVIAKTIGMVMMYEDGACQSSIQIQ